MFCEYRNLFGESRMGFHSVRFLDMALYDWLGTFLLAYIYGRYVNIRYMEALIVTFVVGQVCHKIFCVDTTVLRLFGDSIDRITG